MELEQRVKMLEYEMKVLKSEIQRTLLDIQEQVLIHYYPSLRADESVPTDGIRQALDTVRDRRDAVEPTSDTPQVKRVSLEDVKATDQGGSVSSEEDDTVSAKAGAGQPSALEL